MTCCSRRSSSRAACCSRATVPGRARAPVQVAAIVSGALIAVAIPVVGGFGRLANNPSLLPSEHYGTRLLVVLGVVWALAAVAVVVAARRR